jgi:hypothetical protein
MPIPTRDYVLASEAKHFVKKAIDGPFTIRTRIWHDNADFRRENPANRYLEVSVGDTSRRDTVKDTILSYLST